MKTPITKAPLDRLHALLCPALLCTSLIVAVDTAQAQPAQAFGNLGNFDVRYPNSQPNDLEIVLYGSGVDAGDVKSTWDTDTLLPPPPPPVGPVGGGPPRGLQWGVAQALPVVVNTDSNSPAFGLDCLTLRYSGPPRPDLVDQMVHVGVAMKPCMTPAHWEVWWTINGQRILRPCDPKINWFWITRTSEWVICIENPTPAPIYVYGCRFFQPAETVPLPTLNDLTTAINPDQFGGDWVSVDPPGSPTKQILAWCRIYIRVRLTTTKCFPIIFQIASRNAPLTEAPSEPRVDDWNGEQGTMLIMTQRPAQWFPGDINCDGAVGLPDVNVLRPDFGLISVDR